ncbi:MAG: hypothetical protein OK456_09290 [Thaumarchaeota archaeon]|nr:hypothetical protein [Nitrososphaerota archaeon]
MSVARAEGNKKGRRSIRSRRAAVKDALPDVMPPMGIKEGDDDIAAETDEDDD